MTTISVDNSDEQLGNRHRGSFDVGDENDYFDNQPLIFDSGGETSDALTTKNKRRSSKIIKKVEKRRRNTDGFLGMKRSDFQTFQNESNANIIQRMENGLPIQMQSEMQKKSTHLQSAREMRHLMAKLEEEERKCQTVVEIVGNLEKENQEWEQRNDNLEVQIHEMRAELHIRNLKIESATDSYNQEKQEWVENVQYYKIEIKDLEEALAQKDLQMGAYKAQQADVQIRSPSIDSSNSQSERDNKPTRKERRYIEQNEHEREKVRIRDQRIEHLISQLEENAQLKDEYNQLQEDMVELTELTQEDMMEQALQMKTMEREIILLASRNSALQREKDDLISLLEDKEYEAAMLKTGYELNQKSHRQNRMATNMELSSLVNNLNLHQQMPSVTNEGFDTFFVENESFMGMIAVHSDEMSTTATNQGAVTPQPEVEPVTPAEVVVASTVMKRKRIEPTVRDVVHEYLHLTASVVIIKYGSVGTVTSEDLVNQVKNFGFSEYHDQMVRIMKSEERKIKEIEKKEQMLQEKNFSQRERKQSKSKQVKNSFGGKLKAFRNYWRSGSGSRSADVNGMRNRSNTAGNHNIKKKITKGDDVNKLMPLVKTHSASSGQSEKEMKMKKSSSVEIGEAGGTVGKKNKMSKKSSFSTATDAYSNSNRKKKKKNIQRIAKSPKNVIIKGKNKMNKKMFGKGNAADLSNSSFVSVPDINSPPVLIDDD